MTIFHLLKINLLRGALFREAIKRGILCNNFIFFQKIMHIDDKIIEWQKFWEISMPPDYEDSADEAHRTVTSSSQGASETGNEGNSNIFIN